MHRVNEGRGERRALLYQSLSGFGATIPNRDLSPCSQQRACKAGAHQTSADYRYCFSHHLIPHMGEERSPGCVHPKS
ncbi:hypothetical protein EMIT0P43_30271 [Pseudomonas jessenii]